KGLLDGQVGKPLHFKDSAVKNIDLVLLGNRQKSLLDCPEGDRVDRITQGDTFVEFPLEAHQHRLRHIQRHKTKGSGKSNQTGPGGETDPDGEAGVRIATGTDS